MTDNTKIQEIAGDIVKNLLMHSKEPISAKQIPGLIQDIYASLLNVPSAEGAVAAPADDDQAEAEEIDPRHRPVRETGQKPAVPISESVQKDVIICLEDGTEHKMMKRYIRAKFGMDDQTYRRKWGLPDDYPMVAPNYSKEKRLYAKSVGLGTDSFGRAFPSKASRAAAEPAAKKPGKRGRKRAA